MNTRSQTVLALLAILCLVVGSNPASGQQLGLELPREKLTKILQIWEADQAGVVSGHIVFHDFAYRDEKDSVTLEGVHRLLKLDAEPDFAALVPGRTIPGLSGGLGGPGGWGTKVEVDFELEKVRNATTGISGRTEIDTKITTFDGKDQVEFVLFNEQATIFSPSYFFMEDMSSVRFAVPLDLIDKSEWTIHAEPGRPGVIVKAKWLEIHAEEATGRINHVVIRNDAGHVAKEVFQFGPWTTSAGFAYPHSQVRIECEPRGVRQVKIHRVEECQLNVEIPEGTFRAKTPQATHRDETVIVDRRNGSDVVRSHAGPLSDVIAFANERSAATNPAPPSASTFWRINLALLGVMLLVLGITLYRRSNNRSTAAA